MAKEHGIDLSTVAGTGACGRVSKQDIEAVISGGGPSVPAPGYSEPEPPPAPRPAVVPPPVAPAPVAGPGGAAAHGSQYAAALQIGVPRERLYFGNYEVQPMSVMRQKIAEHMVASKHVSAHVYSVDEIDMI